MPKFYGVRHLFAVVLADRRIVFFRRIDVLMTENVRDDINIARFVIKPCTVSASELMRRNFFQRRHDTAVFFYENLYRTDIDSFILHRQKESVFLRGDLFVVGFFGDIFLEGIFDFVRKIQNSVVSAFSCNDKRIIGKIEAIVIEANQLADTNSRS